MYILYKWISFGIQKKQGQHEKHGIHFSDAEMVLFDPNALTREDLDETNEQRL